MRMSVALPIAAALAIGLSSLAPAKTEAKTLARCKSERAACVVNCVAYPCPQRCHAALAQCAGGAQDSGRGKSVKTGGGEPVPKGPMLGRSTGTNGGGLPIVKRIRR
jgi:hypothetical protein